MQSRTLTNLELQLASPPGALLELAKRLDKCHEPRGAETLALAWARELGRRILEAHLAAIDPTPLSCPRCGASQQASSGKRGGQRKDSVTFNPRRRTTKLVATLLGEVRLKRRIWRCTKCGAEHAPLDMALGLRGMLSEGLVAAIAPMAGLPVRRGSELLRQLCGIRLGAATIYRVITGTRTRPGTKNRAKRSRN
jgi:hypothetical protein